MPKIKTKSNAQQGEPQWDTIRAAVVTGKNSGSTNAATSVLPLVPIHYISWALTYAIHKLFTTRTTRVQDMANQLSMETGTCGMIIDHIGIVVRSLDQGMAMWEQTFGYTRMTQPVVNTRQRVRVVFLHKDGSLPVKLVEPADPGSPVFALAARGGGFHHVCFRADDMEKALQHIEQHSGRVIVRPEPGEAFENEPIAFVYVNGLPTEIIATDKKAMKIVASENRK